MPSRDCARRLGRSAQSWQGPEARAPKRRAPPDAMLAWGELRGRARDAAGAGPRCGAGTRFLEAERRMTDLGATELVGGRGSGWRLGLPTSELAVDCSTVGRHVARAARA